MAVVDASSLFSLAPILHSGQHEYPNIKDLPDIQPRFALPLLDELAARTERLVASLEGPTFQELALIPPTDFGRRTDAPRETARAIPPEDERGFADRRLILCQLSRSNEAGPSNSRTFEVSMSDSAVNLC